jgi:hypothetical protein
LRHAKSAKEKARSSTRLRCLETYERIAYCGDWLVLDELELVLLVSLPVLMLELDEPDWLVALLPELFGRLLLL